MEAAYGPVRTLPHLLEFELLDTSFVGSDSGALDADIVLLDGFRCCDSDLVVSLWCRQQAIRSQYMSGPRRDTPTLNQST